MYQHYRRLEHNAECGAISAASSAFVAEKIPRGVLYQVVIQFKEFSLRSTVWQQEDGRPSASLSVVPQQSPPQNSRPLFRALPENEPPVRLEKVSLS